MLTRNPMRIIAVVLFLITGLVSGQGLTSKGVIAGLNLANVSGEDTEDLDLTMKPGLAVGGYATFDFGLPVAIRPEVIYSQKGFTWDFTLLGIDVESTSAVNYIDINALTVYTINDQIGIYAGPSFGLFAGGKITVTAGGEKETEGITSEDMNGMDIALIIGGSYNLGVVTVEARYSLGLKNAYDADDDMKNNVIQIIVGYGF